VKKRASKPSILCVDDEPDVLEGLQLTLGKYFQVNTAPGGHAGLDLLESCDDIVVVVSDMKMPRMTGSEFLAQVAQRHPQVIRVLLTGQSDMESAVSAVNDGQIFRFLTKPCHAKDLRQSIEAGVEQNRLIRAERELLEKTLKGVVATLSDILSLTNPTGYGRTQRVREIVMGLANAIEVPELWEVEVAAMLCQIGQVLLPDELLEKMHQRKRLFEDEEALVERLPDLTVQLLAKIPRLEGVRSILKHTRTYILSDGENTPMISLEEAGLERLSLAEIPIGSRMLRIAMDFEELESRPMEAAMAMELMQGRQGRYDQDFLDLFADQLGCADALEGLLEVNAQELEIGMVCASDVRTADGALILPRGCEITPWIRDKLQSYAMGHVQTPLCVYQEDQAIEGDS
jgi:response regulator RpfG family c-di-GMP phosphodiesterase